MGFRDYIAHAGGWAIPLIVVAVGAVSGIALFGKFKSGELSLGANGHKVEVARKQDRLDLLKNQLLEAQQRLATTVELRRKAAVHQVLLTELNELKEANATDRSRLRSLEEGLRETEKMFDDYKQRYRNHIRAKAVGTKMDELTTLDGKTYHRVEIMSVGALGMNITHRDGSGRIPFKELPEMMQKQFQFDEEEAEAQQRREAEQRRQRQIALATLQSDPQTDVGNEDDKPEEKRISDAEREQAIEKLKLAIDAIQDRLMIAQSNLIAEKKKKLSRAPQYRQEIQELKAALQVNEARLRELRSMR